MYLKYLVWSIYNYIYILLVWWDNLRNPQLSWEARIRPAVTKAETNHSLNLSTTLRYMLGVDHIISSTRSRASWATNWFRWRWSSFCWKRWNYVLHTARIKITNNQKTLKWIRKGKQHVFKHKSQEELVEQYIKKCIPWVHLPC